MSQIINATRKDIRRVLRDPMALLLSIAIPLMIGGLITIATGGSDGPAPEADLLVVDQDSSVVSGFLLNALAQVGGDESLIQSRKVSLEEGRELIDAGEASALLIIPEDFGLAVLDETPTTLRLITNPAQSILPGIIEETLSIMTDGAFYLHRVLGDELRELTAGSVDGGSVFEDDEIARISVAINQAITRLDKYLFPPALELETSLDEQDAGPEVPIGVLFLPGIMLMSLLFIAQGMSDDVWKELEQGTLRRALAAPGGVNPVLAGKLLAGGMVMSLIAMVILSLGTLYFELPVANLPLAVLWSTLAGIVFLLAMLFLQVCASSRRTGSILIGAFIFPLMMLGGSFFPSETMPAWMAAVGAWTPNGWALEVLKDILLDRDDPSSLAIGAGGLLASGLVVFALATRRLTGRFLRA